MSGLPPISNYERHQNAEIARRRPDLVAEEAGALERMSARYLEIVGSPFGTLATVHTDRARVLRHLIDRAVAECEEVAEAAVEASRHLSSQVGRFTDPQADRLAALIRSHPGAHPEIMPTGDGTIVVNFGPRRGNGAYVVDPHGRSRWVTAGRYAA